MSTEGESDPEPSLTTKFFDEIRRVNLGEKDEIDFSVEELAAIAADVSLLTEFCNEFKRFSQDPDAKLLVIEIVRKLATAQEGTVERCTTSIETIDRYPARLSGGAAIGGTGALLYGAVATGAVPILGPAILVVGGVVGLSACIYGRWRLSRDRSTASMRQKHFEQLVSRLEQIAPQEGGGND